MLFKNPEQLLIDLLQKHRSLSTFDLRRLGFCTPNTVVHSLRKKGVEIKTNLRDTEDQNGHMYKRVAHYSLGGHHEQR